MELEKLKRMRIENAFIELVTAMDEPEHWAVNHQELRRLWGELEKHHGVKVTMIDAWGFFDKKHGTTIADGLRAMDAQLTGGAHG